MSDTIAPPTESSINSEVPSTEIEQGNEVAPEEHAEETVEVQTEPEVQAISGKRKLKLKVDGQEFDEDFDPNDDEAIKRHLQKSKAFDKRLKEFSSYKSQVDSALELLQKDPELFLEKMGLNVDEFAEKRLARKIEELKKSPEQIAQEKMEKELSELREEKKRIEEEKQKFEMENLRNQQAFEIENDINTALEDSKSILPKKNPIVLQRIAQTMLLAMQNGYDNVTAKEVIPFVEKQWKQELNEFFNVMPEEVFEQLVGKTNIDRYRKKKVAARPKGSTTTARQIVQDIGKIKENENEENKKRISYKDFFKLNE